MKTAHKPLEAVLHEMHWLVNLPESVKQQVAAAAFEAYFDAGDVVARKGEPASTWIGVVEGLLKISAVYRSGRVVMFTGIPAGSWVGEGSVLKRELRQYDIFAMRPSRVIHIPGATFRWLLDTSFEFNHLILTHLNERLGQYIGMVEIDRLIDPVARVARAIASLFNPVLYPRMGPLLGLSQAELGELTGLSRQTVNRALRDLEREGILTTAYGGIMIEDATLLRNYQEKEERGTDKKSIKGRNGPK
jgi:CRP/FNR family transcriptional regulator, cyclic AMP receptor protein